MDVHSGQVELNNLPRAYLTMTWQTTSCSYLLTQVARETANPHYWIHGKWNHTHYTDPDRLTMNVFSLSDNLVISYD